jgi:hypothetical protein
MQLLVEHNQLTAFTILHLLEWLESVSILANTPDWPFACPDELAQQLELWREEFQQINGGIIGCEQVKVLLYGEDTILMTEEVRGEFIKLIVN